MNKTWDVNVLGEWRGAGRAGGESRGNGNSGKPCVLWIENVS